MTKRISPFAVIILSAVYFLSSAAIADDSKSVMVSCTLLPLDIQVMKDGSIIVTNDIDDLEDDYRKVFKNVESTHQGTGSCGTYSWVIDYMGKKYQVSEIGCHPANNYHVPKTATAQLTVGGGIADYGFGPILENGSDFWCY